MSQRIDEKSQVLSFCHLKNPLMEKLHWSFNASYELWQTNWTKAFQYLDKLEANEFVKSDNFTRQEDILSLHVGHQCIATVGFRRLDMRLPAFFDDSYLEIWPRDFIKNVLANKQVMIMSGFTIHPEFRFKIFGIPTMHLFMGYIMLFFKNSHVDYLITTVRNDVGLNKLGYMYGARALSRDIPYNNTKVDLTYYQAQDVHETIESKYTDRIKDILNLNSI